MRWITWWLWLEKRGAEHWLPPLVGVIVFVALCVVKPPWKG